MSASDERQRNRENWPRPYGLRRKSGHALFHPNTQERVLGTPVFSHLTLEPPKPAGSASPDPIFARNAIRPNRVNRP